MVLLRHPLRWRRATQERRITSNGSWLGAARRAAAGIHLGGPDLEQTARRHMRLVGARLPFTTRYRKSMSTWILTFQQEAIGNVASTTPHRDYPIRVRG